MNDRPTPATEIERRDPGRAAAGETFLLGQFHAFYREVIALKERVRAGDWLFAGDGDPESGSDDEERAATAVWQRLLTLLERQALAARASGGDFASEVYRQAQYAMAALADEIFLHTPWGGSEAWQSNLLESKLFDSHRAGERIFERIDELLTHRDPVYLELAQIYLLVLSLGFEGKYRDRPEGEAELAAYRRRLFRFVFGRDPLLAAGAEPLVPQAYAATLDQGAGARLPYLKRWAVAAVVLVLAWIAVSVPLWRDLIAELELVVGRILA